jgi:Flp pilus assembly protein TadG
MATLNRSTSEAGQAIIELALTLPLLLLIVLGVFDFGLMFQRYEVVSNAARELARVAVLTGEFTTAQAQTHAANYLAAGGIPSAGANNTLNCTGTVSAGSVCVEVHPETVTLSTSPTKTVTVMVASVSYDHAHIFVSPIMQLFGGSLGTVRLKGVSRMRAEGT